MTYLKRKKMTIIMALLSLLILTTCVLCSPSYAKYKKRIKVNTVNVEIRSYQPSNLKSDDSTMVEE